MKKLFNFKIAGSILLMLALYVSSCKRDVAIQPNTPSVEAVTNDKDAEQKALLAQADQMGKTVYEHLKLNFLSYKAEDYVNPAIREKVMQMVKKSTDEMKNLNVEERIAKNLTDKKMTEKQATYFYSLLQTSKELDALTNFKEVEKVLNGFDRKLLDDKEMKGSEKQVILNASASLKRTLDYALNIIYQPQKGELQQRSFCSIVGKKFSCIASVLVGGLQIAGGFAKNPNDTFAIALGIVNTISAISNVFSNPSCNCSTEEATCYTLYGLALFRATNMDCSGNFVKFCTWGDGPTPGSFSWTLFELNQNGEVIPGSGQDLPNTPDNCANFSPNSDLSKKFLLTVTIEGFPSCNNQRVSKEFRFTWGDIVGDAGTVLIDGPETVYVGNSTTYFANGTFLINPKNTFSWIYNLYQGSYVFGNTTSGGGNSTSATINWTGASCGPGAFGNTGYNGCYNLSIGGRSANSCSGDQSWHSTSVAVYNY